MKLFNKKKINSTRLALNASAEEVKESKAVEADVETRLV